MVNKYPTLANAPIKEAVIQFLVSPNDSYSSDQLKKVVSAESGQYPNSLTQRETLIQFMSGSDGQQPEFTDKGINGYKLSSEDGHNIVQVFKDRIAVSRLDSYTNWGDMFAEACRLWDVYSEILNPNTIKGISVRYINHFLLPPDMKSFEEYLETTPNIPANLPQGLASFFVNYKLPDPDSGAIANVQLLFEGVRYDKGSKVPKLPIVLDTDIMNNVEIDPGDMGAIREKFSQLHNFKNEVFFNTLKEKTLEMFR